MAPKNAKRAPKGQSLGGQPQAKKPKKQASLPEPKPAEEISVDIVLISGRMVGRLVVEPSLKVRQLRERAAQLAETTGASTIGNIAQLLHETEVLENDLTVAESIAQDSVLTLKFEAPPVKLRTISRTSTVSQATAEVRKLKAKLEDHDNSFGVVAAQVSELSSKVAKQKKLLRVAEKELAVASERMNQIQHAKDSLEGELVRARQDARTDYDRIVESLSKHLVVPHAKATVMHNSYSLPVMHDICDLHAAGDINDEEFTKVTDVIAESANLCVQMGALNVIVSVHCGVDVTSPCRSHLCALEKLSTQIVARRHRAYHRADWLALAQAICLNSEATAAVLLVDRVMAHAKKFGSVCCPVRDLMYPILKLLRSANLPAATELETSLCAKLAEGRDNIAWMDLAKIICEHKDSAIAPSLVRGVIARSISWSRALVKSAPQPSYCVGFGTAGANNASSTCPLVDFMAPIFAQLRVLDISELSDLQSALIVELEAVVVKYVPTAQDFSMPAEAAKVGDRNRKLRDFLLSPVQCAVEFNETKAGRMAIHRLIDSTIGHGRLTHNSSGCGHSRTLVVRKAGLEQKREENVQKAKLQGQQRQLLEFMKECAAGKGAPETFPALENLLDSFNRPSHATQASQTRSFLGDEIDDLFWDFED